MSTPDSTLLPPPGGATLEDVLRFLERLAAADGGGETIPARVALEVYARAVRELRTIGVDTRARIERAAAVVTEARECAHRRRRRARKIAHRRRPDPIEGPR